MQTSHQSNYSNIAAQALKELDEKTASSDQRIVDMYTSQGFHSLDEVARAMGTTRTGVMLALYRHKLLPGQQH